MVWNLFKRSKESKGESKSTLGDEALKFLRKNRKPHTAQEIYEALRGKKSHRVAGTFYRTLDSLVAKKLITRSRKGNVNYYSSR